MAVDPPLPPPERPTEPLLAARAPVRERVVAGAPVADATHVEWLHDTVRSLRTTLALVGLLAVVALAVAIYALLKADNGDGRGASQARVSRLDDRVNRLSRQVQSTRASNSGDANAGDLQEVKRRLALTASASNLQSLRTSVTQLKSTVTQQGSASGASADPQAIADLGQRVDDLTKEVAQLKQDAQQTP